MKKDYYSDYNNDKYKQPEIELTFCFYIKGLKYFSKFWPYANEVPMYDNNKDFWLSEGVKNIIYHDIPDELNDSNHPMFISHNNKDQCVIKLFSDSACLKYEKDLIIDDPSSENMFKYLYKVEVN